MGCISQASLRRELPGAADTGAVGAGYPGQRLGSQTGF